MEARAAQGLDFGAVYVQVRPRKREASSLVEIYRESNCSTRAEPADAAQGDAQSKDTGSERRAREKARLCQFRSVEVCASLAREETAGQSETYGGQEREKERRGRN